MVAGSGMRKIQKQQLLDCINSLQQAHEEIKSALNRKNYGSVQTMLSECQEFAVSIGETIEKLEGEGHVAVSQLEGYCETLYRLFEQINSGTLKGGEAYNALKKQLIKVESSVKGIQAKKEVVFLPYKASMWDSLESIYLAAREDKNCETFVIPVPYFDKNPDGSMGQMHYEGGEFPEDIPITSWQEYSIPENKPDAIYIHNPYDECNLVTSVHPEFYARELQKYTDELVYVPYFVLGEIEPDDQTAIDEMKHFVWTPGVIYADRVIVQSEKMKQIYVNEYLKAARAAGLTGGHIDKKYLDRKILGLGSPKIDKVLNTKKEELDIPEEWLKVIRRPDGSWKKIILYNTGISALLAHNEQWVDKIERSLKIFKENREEVALLWRPHPLIESTMQSMRPQILWRYREIKNRYLNEGWGIFDDTADMDRAVVLSDAYYGDGSSVMQLYQQTGKPVMCQNVLV